VSYGGHAGGARAVEHLRLIMAEVMVATVRAQVLLSLFTDFENFKTFSPASQREKELHATLDQLIAWGGALKALRSHAAEEAPVAGE
jgi:NAD(P)H-dependent FMN reductase